MRFRSALSLIISLSAIPLRLSAQEAVPAGSQRPGTMRMVERLKKLASTPGNNPFANVERAAALRQQMERESNPRKQDEVRYRYAKELLFAGESREALKELTRLDDPVPGSFPDSILTTVEKHGCCWP